ncbi:MAG: adenylate cyclase [Cyclobacteriaceae bacterium]|nr:MAG: adenylate cyclase [Cyclobacteriaceae bacterium]
MNTPDRHPKAVLFSDIEGYTAMMQTDEATAIEVVNRYQQELEKTVPAYHGEVKQHYGDGSLTIFPTAADAVGCALELQKTLIGSIPLRMGIHYGNVVLHQDKVFGDTVNIASRIESLGQSGAVLFSDQVYLQIKSNPEFKAESMGHYQFKNVKKKMEVFALSNPGLVLPKTGALKGKLEPKKPSKTPIIVSILFGVLLIALLVFNGIRSPQTVDTILTGNLNPSIAVLPFTNLSADTAQEFFADGLAQEVLNLLTQDPQLRVTSRTSSFSFKGQQIDMPSIAEKLGVNYILDGSVQKSGNSVRISAQLVNAREDSQLWAQSWGRDLDDIFGVQQEIADSVKTALKLQIMADRKRSVQPANSEAYTLFLQARHTGQQGNVNRLENAEVMLRESLALDSTYAPAWAYLAVVLNRQSNIGLRPAEEGQELAREAAYKALSIDSTLSSAWSTLVSISMNYDREFQKARFFLDKARQWDANGINVLKLASNLAFSQGNIEEAISLDQQALEIDPVSPKHYLDLGYGYFCNSQWKEAEQVTRRGLLMNPEYLGGDHLLSMILMEQQKLPEAKQAALSEPYEILKIQALALVAQAMGETDSAAFFLQQIKDQHAMVASYQIAQVYAYQKQADSTFKWLQKAFEYRDGGLAHIQADPFFKRLKGDSRWDALMVKMGFR